MARELQTLFPSLVQISDIEGAAALNERLMPAIEAIRAETPNSRPDSWASTVYTTLNSADQLHELPDFAPLTDHILREAAAFAEALKLDHQRYPLRISDCWFNIYGPKDGQESHLHANNLISGSYYVKAPEGSSGLMFHSPMDNQMLDPPYSAFNDFNTVIAEMPIEEGRMVLFRSFMRHSVRPSAIDDERISISFNLTM